LANPKPGSIIRFQRGIPDQRNEEERRRRKEKEKLIVQQRENEKEKKSTEKVPAAIAARTCFSK
jgi:hypothetical protein